MAKAKMLERRMARAQFALKREIEKREPYDLVLVVCEGEKSEPNYLRSLKTDLGLSNANIRIAEEAHGSDPLSVVRFAIKTFEEESITYDRIYCVFDKDGHTTYEAALNLVRDHALGRQGKLFAINSVPCFEIWLLLHFQYTTKAFTKVGQHSSCGQVVRDLRAHIHDYEKNHHAIYEVVKPNSSRAIAHAKRLHRHCSAVNSDNPSTRVHLLVEYLQTVRR